MTYLPDRRKGGHPRKPALRSREEAWALALANKGLVHHWALRMSPSPEQAEDLVQAGMIGLLRACELFDESRGYALSTYASPLIRRAIQRGVQGARFVHVPAYITGKERLDLVRRLRPWRLTDPGKDDEMRRQSDNHPADPAAEREPALDLEEERQQVRRLLADLEPRAALVLEMRYFEGRRRQEVANEMGVSRQRVAEIEARALDDLREKLTAAAGA
jgi:RNA polymerase sigma factor (sigma-70 family)